MATATSPARLAVRLLSGYVCGTHSGVLACTASGRRLRAAQPESVAAAHRRSNWAEPDGERLGLERQLGRERWQAGEQTQLAKDLHRTLDHPAVIDLIFYGSQARGGRTGFSDVDAILVVNDQSADDAASLRRLRSCVLAAQRAVLAHQPMQHHSFEVVTPRLLRQAGQALALPAAALSQTSSLNGTGISAWLPEAPDGANVDAFVGSLCRVRSWPAHPWEVHRLVAMFELLPAVYLQARGASVPKWRSFEEARAEFNDAWWPYDVLSEVRRVWPRLRRPLLETSAKAVRNPWLALAAWRKVPASLPAPVGPLLTPGLLTALQALADSMVQRSR
jgi:hypothetical protein